jgi:hypothetical protein
LIASENFNFPEFGGIKTNTILTDIRQAIKYTTKSLIAFQNESRKEYDYYMDLLDKKE